MNLKNVDYRTFHAETDSKRIVCVGAGKLLDDMFSMWDSSVTSRVVHIFDNYKSGIYKTILGTDIPVDKVEAIAAMELDSCVILVTSMYCRSLFNQLSSLLNNVDVDCYLYPLMSLMTSDFKVERRNKQQIIPKKIHYFWFGKGKIPEENRKCIDSWKRHCPDYEIIKWTEDNYDITKCRYMQQAYESRKWGFVPDYARLDVIYQYGGIYLDTDVELIKNLDDLLYQDAFVGFQRDFWVALGLGFGGKSGNSIFKEMREEYEKENFIQEGNKLNLTASPYYQTKVLRRHGLKCNNQLQYVNDITVFPTEVLDPQGYSFGSIKITKNTYSIHHYNESWVDIIQRENNKRKYMEVESFR